LGERSGAPSGLRPSSLVICNTSVEGSIYLSRVSHYPCRTPGRYNFKETAAAGDAGSGARTAARAAVMADTVAAVT
jgi:hypothetical protein